MSYLQCPHFQNFPTFSRHVFLVYNVLHNSRLLQLSPDLRSSQILVSYQSFSIFLELIFPHYPSGLVIAPTKFSLIHVDFVVPEGC